MEDKIIEAIKKLTVAKKLVIVGIDGIGGAGKTTLSNKIKRVFPEARVISTDEFFDPSKHWADKGRLNQQLIKPLKEGGIASYQRYEWSTGSLGKWYEVSPKGLIIIEGIRALDEDYIDQYDLTIWVDCPMEVAVDRIIKRDNGEDMDSWENFYRPFELKYIKQQDPRSKADFVMKTNSGNGFDRL